MIPRICTVVTGNDLQEFLKKLQQIQIYSDLVELRVDFIKDFKQEYIPIIKQKLTKTAIFTCRRKDEGGYFRGKEIDRVSIIRNALTSSFPYVDIELSTLKEYNFNKRTSKIICSYHDFDKTPEYTYLHNILEQMNGTDTDIHKIATMSNSEEDNQTLYRLMTEQTKKKRIIVGMGEHGKVTRILGPILGSYLTYARTAYTQSAPGQIEINELKHIYTTLYS